MLTRIFWIVIKEEERQKQVNDDEDAKIYFFFLIFPLLLNFSEMNRWALYSNFNKNGEKCIVDLKQKQRSNNAYNFEKSLL